MVILFKWNDYTIDFLGFLVKDIKKSITKKGYIIN